jgi:hypothetical protein
MVTTMAGAKEKLQEELRQKRKSSNIAIRIIPYPSITNTSDRVFGKERKGDQVAKSIVESNLLLIAPGFYVWWNGYRC